MNNLLKKTYRDKSGGFLIPLEIEAEDKLKQLIDDSKNFTGDQVPYCHLSRESELVQASFKIRHACVTCWICEHLLQQEHYEDHN